RQRVAHKKRKSRHDYPHSIPRKPFVLLLIVTAAVLQSRRGNDHQHEVILEGQDDESVESVRAFKWRDVHAVIRKHEARPLVYERWLKHCGQPVGSAQEHSDSHSSADPKQNSDVTFLRSPDYREEDHAVAEHQRYGHVSHKMYAVKKTEPRKIESSRFCSNLYCEAKN